MKFFVWKGFILRKWPRYRTISTSFSRRWAHVALRSQKLGQANKVIGGDTEDEDGAHLSEAAHLHLREPADRLAPAEAFLDAFAQPLADRIAKARRDVVRDGGLAHPAILADRSVDRHVRLDPARLQPLDEGLGVVVLSAPRVAPSGDRSLKRAAASRSAVPVAQVASAATTSPLRFSINAWPR